MTVAQAKLAKTFEPVVISIMQELRRDGFDPVITSGLRSEALQRKLVAQGRSPILHSFHLIGRAADMVDKATLYELPAAKPFFLALGSAALRRGLSWGGLWDLPAKQRAKLETLLRSGRHDLARTFKLGRDPSHIEQRYVV